MNRKEGLAVDIGGVLVPTISDKGDRWFSRGDYLETPSMAGAFDALRELKANRFGEKVYLVSKCGPRARVKTLRWLKYNRFFDDTGVKPKNVHFCPDRKDKDHICSRLGITHFVDDRVDVLLCLRTVPNRYLLQASADDLIRIPTSIHVVRNWPEIVSLLLP